LITRHITALHAAPALAAALLLSGPAQAQKSLDAFTQPGLKDLSAGIQVVSKNNQELKKIGKDYVDAYTLSNEEIQCKEPGKVRFQGKRGLLTLRTITNGNRKLTEVPPLHHHVENLRAKPGKGDSISDLGVITPAWADRVESRWLRAENRAGKTLQVFEYWYKEDPGALHTLWVDPATKTIVEHVYHNRNKKKPGFRKRLVYSEVKQVNGVSVPTRMTLYNGENKEAASMRYDRVQVNTNLKDGLFNF
jgi:outer membrane lipoprotein-sorting protein